MNLFIKSLLTILVVAAISTTKTSCIYEANDIYKIPDANNELMGEIIFEDDFNQSNKIPDTTKWVLRPDIWSNHFSESYDQAYIENGKLILKAEKIGNEYKGGAIHTKNKFEFTYGKVEVCARIHSAKGGWPAIWMLPSSRKNGISDGEIDIMEQINNENIIYHTIHNYYSNILKNRIPFKQATVSYNINYFNVYTIRWTPNWIAFYVNDRNTFNYPNMHLKKEKQVKQWPFNKPFYIILNYALGGPGTWPGDIVDSQLPAYMEIDWIKVTQ